MAGEQRLGVDGAACGKNAGIEQGEEAIAGVRCAKFMSQKELTRLGVEFCQLPYAIHRIMGD